MRAKPKGGRGKWGGSCGRGDSQNFSSGNVGSARSLDPGPKARAQGPGPQARTQGPLGCFLGIPRGSCSKLLGPAPTL